MDLKLTKTDAALRVVMPDASEWDVPLQLVADDRSKYYKEDSVLMVQHKQLDTEELIEWAANNMDWEEVQAQATQVKPADPPDYQDGWVNGTKTIKGDI